MRIIDKRSRTDYYDGVRAYGIDEALRYVRLQRDMPWGDAPRTVRAAYTAGMPRSEPRLAGGSHSGGVFLRDAGGDRYTLIGFCGRLYVVYVVCGMGCFSADDVERAIHEAGTRLAEHAERLAHWERAADTRKTAAALIERFNEPPSRAKWSTDLCWGNRRMCREVADTWLPTLQGVEFGSGPFVDLDTPVFSVFNDDRDRCGLGPRRVGRVGGIVVRVNPLLSSYRFQALMDPVTAYQEIAMYVGGVLPKPGPPMVTISDDIMRDEKGFDEQSFRNVTPGERKARRRANREAKRVKREAGGT